MKKEKMTIQERARRFAINVHVGQYRDDGYTPFSDHPVMTAQILEQVTDDPNLIAAAYLHDIIEDTEVDEHQLRQAFNDDVVDLVLEVTKVGKHFPNLKTRRGVMLKFADRLSNLSDMTGWDEDKRQWYIKKSTFWTKGDEDVKPTDK